MRRHVALAAVLITLAVAVPLVSWAFAAHEATWRRESRIEKSEQDRQRRLSEDAARRIADRLRAALQSPEGHPFVKRPLDAGEASRLPAGPPGWTLVSLEIDGRPGLVARRLEPRIEAWLLDEQAIESEQGVQLRPVTHAGGARLPLAEAAALAWGVHVEDPAATEAAHSRALALRADFRRQVARAVVVAVLAWGLALTVLVQAVAVERRRAALAAVAAHELRTPLSSLSVHAELLADAPGLAAEHRERAALIASEAARLARVVTNVLDGARLERAGLSLQPKEGDLGAAVRAEVERVAPSLRRDGVDLRVDVAPESVRATFDEEALAHVLGNLLDNAARHGCPREGGRIEVELRREGAGRAVLDVVDHGPGAGARRSRRGLGLGLGIARRLARLQGGSLRLIPTPGGGTTARLELPGEK